LSVFNKENDDDNDAVRLLNDDSSKTGHNRFLKISSRQLRGGVRAPACRAAVGGCVGL